MPSFHTMRRHKHQTRNRCVASMHVFAGGQVLVFFFDFIGINYVLVGDYRPKPIPTYILHDDPQYHSRNECTRLLRVEPPSEPRSPCQNRRGDRAPSPEVCTNRYSFLLKGVVRFHLETGNSPAVRSMADRARKRRERSPSATDCE